MTCKRKITQKRASNVRKARATRWRQQDEGETQQRNDSPPAPSDSQPAAVTVTHPASPPPPPPPPPPQASTSSTQTDQPQPATSVSTTSPPTPIFGYEESNIITHILGSSASIQETMKWMDRERASNATPKQKRRKIEKKDDSYQPGGF